MAPRRLERFIAAISEVHIVKQLGYKETAKAFTIVIYDSTVALTRKLLCYDSRVAIYHTGFICTMLQSMLKSIMACFRVEMPRLISAIIS